MNFVESIRSAFAKYGVADGRASRSEYWWFFLFYLGLIVIGYFLNTQLAFGLLEAGDDAALWWLTWSPLSNVPMLAMFLPMLMLGIRRMHDINKSGTWVLVSFVPIFGWAYWLYLAAQEGDEEENAYGVNPKLDWLNAETDNGKSSSIRKKKTEWWNETWPKSSPSDSTPSSSAGEPISKTREQKNKYNSNSADKYLEPEVDQRTTETKNPTTVNLPEAKKSRETLEKIPPKSNSEISVIDPISRRKDAFFLMEYNSKIEDIFNAIKHLPDSYQDKFLISVTEEKIESLVSLKDDLIKEYDKEINPFDKSEYNDLYNYALSLSKVAAEEVEKVIRLSNDDIDSKEIKEKIDKKFNSLIGLEEIHFLSEKNVEITSAGVSNGRLFDIFFGDPEALEITSAIYTYLNEIGLFLTRDSRSNTWVIKTSLEEGGASTEPLTLEQLVLAVRKMIEKLGVSRSDWDTKQT